MKKLILLSLVSFMILLSCKEEKVITNVDYNIEYIYADTREVEIEGTFTADSDVQKITVIYSDDYDMNEHSSVTASISGNHFSINIYDLAPNTEYYYYLRFIGVNNSINSDKNEFVTKEEIILELPVVTTKSASNITHISAMCGGNVTNDGGASVFSRGICWSTSPNPTVSGNHATSGSGTGEYSCSITGLSQNTKYYVRAYATNSVGTSYGDEKSFTTTSNNNPVNEWLKYDNGIADNAIGFSSGPGSFYWGVRFPASMMQEYAGASLTKVYYKSWDETHNGNIYIYIGGENSPETLVYSQAYNADKIETAFEFELNTPIQIDPSKSLWIAMRNNNGQYIATTAEATTDNPDGRWNSNDGINWYDIEEDGIEDVTWIIRGFVTDEIKGEVMIDPIDYNHTPSSMTGEKSLRNN